MQVVFAFLIIILIVALIVWSVTMWSKSNTRSLRLSEKQLRQDLTNERQRSTIGQNALREIAAGAEMPVFKASDALSEINQTYSKEIA